MPKFRIGGSYGYVGTDWEDVVEADDIEQAREWAWDQACERVDTWVEEIEDDEQEGGEDDQP